MHTYVPTQTTSTGIFYEFMYTKKFENLVHCYAYLFIALYYGPEKSSLVFQTKARARARARAHTKRKKKKKFLERISIRSK